MSSIHRKRAGKGGYAPPSNRFTARAGLVLASLAAALAVAACGSSSSAATSSRSAATNSKSVAGTSLAARQKFASCLKQHGVTLPNRAPGANGYRGGGGGYGPPAGGTGTASGGTGTASGGTGTAPGGTGTTGAPTGLPRGGGRFFSGGGPNSKFAQAFKACAKYRPNVGTRPGRRFQPRFSTKVLDAFVTCVRKHGFPQMPDPKATGSGGFFPTSIETNAKFKAAAAKCQSLLRPGAGTGSSTSTNSSPA